MAGDNTPQQIGEEIEDDSDKALRRRGGAGLRAEVKEANRIYDPEKEQQWGLRYRNFSGEHMRNAYRIFAEARHDPFNKDPSWHFSVMRHISKKLKQRGMDNAEKLFRMADLNKDGVLERGEVRKMLIKVIPDLGDLEMAAVFEVLDSNHDNQISGDEVASAFFGARSTIRPTSLYTSEPRRVSRAGQTTSDIASGITQSGITQCSSRSDAKEMANKYRTPVHRVARMPPARLEGWDHLQHTPRFTSEQEVMKAKQNDMFARIGEHISSPRDPAHATYRYFGGGCDVKRFHVQRWRREKEVQGAGSIASPSVPDPGGCDIKPGFHVALRAIRPELASFSLSPRPAGASKNYARTLEASQT